MMDDDQEAAIRREEKRARENLWQPMIAHIELTALIAEIDSLRSQLKEKINE